MTALATGRIVILGAGLAALSAALRLAPRPVLVVSPDPLGQGASSAWAQGGVAAAMDPADSPEAHAADTLRAGAGLVEAEVARLVTGAAPDHIRDLTALGAPFDRTETGAYVLSREAAHSASRVVRVGGDSAGAEIMRALVAAVRRAPSVQVLEGAMATGLETRAGRVIGVRLMRTPASAQIVLHAPAVLLAAGGVGGLYALTTNPPRIAGQAVGMAARAGAVIADAEFVQFHPTAMDVGLDPAPLATEALRGEGAHLVNAQGGRFMLAVHPDAELAPRDVVARAVYLQAQAGLRPALDTQNCLGPRILTEFPAVAAACPGRGSTPPARRSRSPPRRITTWAGSKAIATGAAACPVCGSAARRPRPGCTARTALPRTGCSRRWSLRRARRRRSGPRLRRGTTPGSSCPNWPMPRRPTRRWSGACARR